jgi:hypothetical protein
MACVRQLMVFTLSVFHLLGWGDTSFVLRHQSLFELLIVDDVGSEATVIEATTPYLRMMCQKNHLDQMFCHKNLVSALKE